MKIKNIQANGGDEMQFKVPDGWNTAHNLSSREKIYAELSMKFGDKFSEKEYKMAIRRSYENSRLKHREASDLALKRKNKNRRIGNTTRWQTLKRRERVISEEEKDFWKNVKAELMSDEEPCDEENVVILKTPAWRAEPLNQLIKQLDDRLDEKGVFSRMVKKRNRCSLPSTRCRPINFYTESYVIPQQ
ncbi:uncharacterized protein C14orf93 homolog [Ptychodera flava]|uniref:uncharacterized protein C14orf93 homolog n=1 Tax=Ptychodera flava TaxID=63121 RepID=UPI003969D775